MRGQNIMNIKSVNVSHLGHKIAVFYVQNEMSYMYTNSLSLNVRECLLVGRKGKAWILRKSLLNLSISQVYYLIFFSVYVLLCCSPPVVPFYGNSN